LKHLALLAAGVLIQAAGCAPLGDIYAKPEPFDEPILAHWINCTWVYQGQQLLDIDRDLRRLTGRMRRAIDLRPDGSPLESPLYSNRSPADLSPDQLAKGPNTDPPPLSPIEVTKAKEVGAQEGFFGRDALGREYLFKFGAREYPEMVTGAEIIGSRLYWGLGYNVPQTYLVTVAGTGRPEYDGRRAIASEIVPEEVVGYADLRLFRNRREVRSLHVAAAWMNNTDCKTLNVLATWDGEKPKYYLIDFARSLGSASTEGPKAPWEGRRNRFDFGEICLSIATAGLHKPSYDTHQPVVSPAVGRFNADFDPRKWKSLLPNVAFEDRTEEDSRWMARKIAGFTDEKIRAVVGTAQYSRSEDADYIARILAERRDIIVETYLGSEAEGNHQ